MVQCAFLPFAACVSSCGLAPFHMTRPRDDTSCSDVSGDRTEKMLQGFTFFPLESHLETLFRSESSKRPNNENNFCTTEKAHKFGKYYIDSNM